VRVEEYGEGIYCACTGRRTKKSIIVDTSFGNVEARQFENFKPTTSTGRKSKKNARVVRYDFLSKGHLNVLILERKCGKVRMFEPPNRQNVKMTEE